MQDALELTHHFPETWTYGIIQPGVHFRESHGWIIVHGKNEGDWRGTTVMCRSETFKHTNTYEIIPHFPSASFVEVYQKLFNCPNPHGHRGNRGLITSNGFRKPLTLPVP